MRIRLQAGPGGRNVSDFVDRLHNSCEGEGLVWCDSDDFCGAGGQCGCAGYRDWRIPNIRELQSVVDYDRVSPSVHPACNAGCNRGCKDCSCTYPSVYRSSSTYARAPSLAWLVNVSNGNVGYYYKIFYEYSVRVERDSR